MLKLNIFYWFYRKIYQYPGVGKEGLKDTKQKVLRCFKKKGNNQIQSVFNKIVSSMANVKNDHMLSNPMLLFFLLVNFALQCAKHSKTVTQG